MALEKLERYGLQLRERETMYADILQYVRQAQAPYNRQKLAKAKLVLAQMVGELDKLQMEKVDSVQTVDLVSGKDFAK